MRECPTCNHRNNPDHATTCVACRLELPRSNPYTPLPKPNQKMVVFDLDKTLYDLTRRERIAKREGHKPGSSAWYSSMNKTQHIPKDTAIPGTLDFARKLEQDGYAIAYLTGRPDTIKAATRQKLKEDGFPIHRFREELLFFSPTVNSSIGSIANYKKGILTRLSNEFDIAFFFDDSREFREAAKTVQPRIPGIYSSIADYTGKEEQHNRKNPGHGEHLCHRTTAVGYTGIYYACSKPAGHSGRHDFSIEMQSPELEDGDNPFDNPPGSSILPIYAGTPTSKYTNKGMVTAEIQIGRNLIKDVGEAVQSIYRGLVGGRTAMAEKRMALALASMQKELSDRATVKGGNAVANLKVDYEMISESATLTLIATADAIKMARPKKVRSNPTSELVMVNPPPKPRKKRNKAGNMIKEPVKNYLQRFMGNSKMVEEFPDNAQRFAVGLSYAKKFYGEKTVNKHYPPVRTNPGVSVADAKKMYKQFHQKNPSKVEKKTMNIGETWVGLGKAWSIGYRSGKETGDEKQKYIHNFGVDEETGKKFKEPELFYVPGEGGSDDLLIVTGGDWYIDVDADGKVSWIYI